MAATKQYTLKKKKSPTLSIFFVIIIFIFVLFPFFIMNLRYQIGAALSSIINGIGGFCLTIGGFFLIFGIVGILTRSRSWMKHVIVGVILLWIGSWCTGTIISFFGFNIGPDTNSGSGYH